MKKIDMPEFAFGFLMAETADNIRLKKLYVLMNDENMYDAVLFSRIVFWHGRSRETGKTRLKVEKEGHLWLVKSFDDWWEECAIKAPTARKCLKRIEKRGLIVTKVFRFNKAPTTHIRIDWANFEKALLSCISRSDTTYQMDLIQRIRSITVVTNSKKKEDNKLSSSSLKNLNEILKQLISAWKEEFGEDLVIDGFSFKKKRVPSSNNQKLRQNLKHWLEQSKPQFGEDDRFVVMWEEAFAEASKNHGLRSSKWFTLEWFTGKGKQGKGAGYWRILNGDFDFLHDEFLQNNERIENEKELVRHSDGGFNL